MNLISNAGLVNAGLVMLAVAGAILLILYVCGRMLLRRRQHSEDAPGGLRRPGQSLRIYVLRLDIAARLTGIGLLASAVLLPLGHLGLSHFARAPETLARTLLSAGGGALFMVLLFLSWLRLRARRRNFRRRLEGQRDVGRALEALAEKGYQIYHDFPADQTHIGHIVIGPAGVLAVETKAPAPDAARRQRSEPIVNYDGRMLHFPKISDHQTIDHAKSQAHWLSQWLTDAVGDPISARAIVAIPGWHVKRTSADGIPVVNPRQFSTLFEHIKPRPLTDVMIQRIAQCIERQSMTGEPSVPGR